MSENISEQQIKDKIAFHQEQIQEAVEAGRKLQQDLEQLRVLIERQQGAIGGLNELLETLREHKDEPEKEGE